MNRPSILFLNIIFLIFFSINSNATVFTAVSNGDWDQSSVWDQGSVPGLSDTVVINGYKVDIDNNTGNVDVKRIVLLNTNENATTNLNITGSITVAISGDLIADLEDKTVGIELNVLGGAILNLSGHLTFTRYNSTGNNNELLINVANASRINVSGNFTFDYQDQNATENFDEILLDDTAILTVTGHTYIYMKGGADFTFTLLTDAQAILNANLEVEVTGGDQTVFTAKNDGHFQVSGNFNVTNSGSTTHTKIHADGSHGKFSIGGDLTLKSTAADKITFLEVSKSNCVLLIKVFTILMYAYKMGQKTFHKE